MFKAYAKVNLGLTIYQIQENEIKHKIESIFIKYKELYDEISIIENNKFEIRYKVHNEIKVYENDIVTKCINYLVDKFNLVINDSILINKHIPEQAGLGGSSTDGAFILKYYLDKNKINIESSLLLDIALKLGSDIPFFMLDYDMALVSNYGDVVLPIKKTIPKLKLISNKLECSTREIYKKFDELNLANNLKNDFNHIIDNLSNLNNCIIINDLEKPAFSLVPELKFYKKPNSLMSGSGSYFIEWEVQDEN